jgi:hypothetical protein
MREIKEICVRSIKMDRDPNNRDTYLLAKYLEHGGSVPPIHVAINKCGRFIIRDGRHRVLAHKLLGRKMIMAKFSTRKMEDK